MSKSVKITLSDDEYRLLVLWARWHNRTPANYAGQVVAARIEANIKTIQELIALAAEARGVDVKALEADWLGTQPNDDGE